MGSLAHLLANMSNQELLDIAMGFRIEREMFTDAWHDRFHDNKDFIRYVFDTFDINEDGSLSGRELEGVIDMALEHGGDLDPPSTVPIFFLLLCGRWDPTAPVRCRSFEDKLYAQSRLHHFPMSSLPLLITFRC